MLIQIGARPEDDELQAAVDDFGIDEPLALGAPGEVGSGRRRLEPSDDAVIAERFHARNAGEEGTVEKPLFMRLSERDGQWPRVGELETIGELRLSRGRGETPRRRDSADGDCR